MIDWIIFAYCCWVEPTSSSADDPSQDTLSLTFHRLHHYPDPPYSCLYLLSFSLFRYYIHSSLETLVVSILLCKFYSPSWNTTYYLKWLAHSRLFNKTEFRSLHREGEKSPKLEKKLIRHKDLMLDVTHLPDCSVAITTRLLRTCFRGELCIQNVR